MIAGKDYSAQGKDGRRGEGYLGGRQSMVEEGRKESAAQAYPIKVISPTLKKEVNESDGKEHICKRREGRRDRY